MSLPIPLPDTFTKLGFKFERIEVFEDGWEIFKRMSKTKTYFELVKPYLQKELTVYGNIVPEKIRYPSTNEFGRLGFCSLTLERAHELHDKILKEKKEEAAEIPVINRPLNIPAKESFTIKDLLALNISWEKKDVCIKVKYLLEKLVISKTGEKHNKCGRSSILYKKN